MIFFTVGTERFAFDRLIQMADVVQEALKREEVFVQLGESRVVPKQCAWSRFLSYDELVRKLKEARIVVTHAGVGILLLCTRFEKVPIALPREKHFREHVDDHQVELAKKMAHLGYLLLAKEAREILPLIQRYDERERPLSSVSWGDPPLAKTLSDYLTNNGFQGSGGAAPRKVTSA